MWEAQPTKKRGRPRKVKPGADKIAAEAAAAFPAGDSEEIPFAPSISEDAKEKKKVLEAVKEIPEIFSPEQVEWLFDAYAGALSFIYSIVLKTDFAELWKELKFEDDIKKSLSKPLSKILSKHAPASWAAHTAEIELITMLGVYTAASFKRARNVQLAQMEKKKDAERTQPVQPMRREVLHPS